MEKSQSLMQIELSDQDREDLVKLGSLRWGEDRIAAFFGWPRPLLTAAMNDTESEVSRLLLKGELKARFDIESRLMSDAVGGNMAAAKQFSELMHDREFKISKLDLFGGSEDTALFDKIQEYISSGCPGDLDTRQQLYVDSLQLIYGMATKFGERKTVKFLTKEPYCLKYDKARDLVAESIEMFNAGRHTSKMSLRYHTAEAYDTLYHAILDNARTSQDYALAASILDKKVKLLALNEPDPAILPPEQYAKTYRVLSLTTESLGLPPAKRAELAAQIDALDVPDREKRRLNMEAGVIDTDIVEILENASQD